MKMFASFTKCLPKPQSAVIPHHPPGTNMNTGRGSRWRFLWKKPKQNTHFTLSGFTLMHFHALSQRFHSENLTSAAMTGNLSLYQVIEKNPIHTHPPRCSNQAAAEWKFYRHSYPLETAQNKDREENHQQSQRHLTCTRVEPDSGRQGTPLWSTPN